MNDADTLTRAAELMESAIRLYPPGPRAEELTFFAARLREMAAARKRIAEWDIDLASIEELRFCAHVQRGSIDRLHARIAELEEAVKYWPVVDMERQARIAELEDAAQRALSDRDRLREALEARRSAENYPEPSCSAEYDYQSRLYAHARRLTVEALKESGNEK